MGTKIKTLLRKIRIKRTTILLALFVLMAGVLIQRLFTLQIIQGENYVSSFQSRTTKTRTLKSTRGNIFDRDGNLLASNKLAYSLTLEDNGSYEDTRTKNLTLNGIIYQVLKILKQNGDTVYNNFHIKLDDNNEYIFDVDEGFTLNRFRADIYGYSLIDDLTEEEAVSTAPQIMDELCGEDRFSIVLSGEDAYTAQELAAHNLPSELTKQEILDIAMIRYQLSNNSFQKYLAVTIATDVSEETVAAIMENLEQFQGIDVVEDSIRVYEDHESLGPILGYTGQASAEELEELMAEDSSYTTNAVIGKAGIEQYMETTLHGQDGQETVSVDNMGKVLKIDADTLVKPVAGDDVHLTIKRDWMEDIYEILKQRVAGILLSHIDDAKTFDVKSISDTMQIRIPIYDCYFQLMNNNVIDIDHFAAEDASETEKSMYVKFQQKQQEVFDTIRNEFVSDNPQTYQQHDEQMREYLEYLASDLLTNQLDILSIDMIDVSDPTYKAWEEDGSISLKEYLTYAASQNWIDISKIAPDGEYLDSAEVYQALTDYVIDYLKTDLEFSKIIYKYMLQEDRISGQEVCITLYDQGVLDKEDSHYEQLVSGTMTAYDFMITKIYTLEIEPAMLALDPCSASAVVVDPNSGQVLACVTYPGYNNNRLSNNMDVDYYAKLALDASSPFFNKATQQRTAPGSTFKLVSTIAGAQWGYFSTNGGVYTCTGSFDLITPDIDCWNTYGCGTLDLSSAIEQSCNPYFNMIGYTLGQDSNGEYSDSQTLSRLQSTASAMALDQKSGIEIVESTPKVSDAQGVASYMGQGTNSYTTTQLARYAALLANSGTAYKLTLLDKVTDSSGNIIEDNPSQVVSTVSLDQTYWDQIHNGMQRVITSNSTFSTLTVSVAGKTGTAQERVDRPDHALFIGYAPVEDPQYAVSIRVANGYSSANCCYIADDIFKYIFNLTDKKSIITGYASSETTEVTRRD